VSSTGLGEELDHAGVPTKRGRTRSTTTRLARRTARKIRFTAAEWQLIEASARACGRAPARYVRETSLDAVPKRSRVRSNAPIIREVGAISVMLQEAQRSLVAAHDGTQPRSNHDANVVIDAAISRLLGIVHRLA